MTRVKNAAYAALGPYPQSQLQPYQFSIAAPVENEVLIEVQYVGICHSDLHNVNMDWGRDKFPVVPGHEIAGIVVETGSNVTKFKIGDRIGVGCITGACHQCTHCKNSQEQFCPNCIFTYNGQRRGEITRGGYGRYIVCDELCGIHVPESVSLDTLGPMMCAGITTYSPLARYGAKTGGKRILVVGLGGLGHMGVQLAVAMGNDVYVMSRTNSKTNDALRMGVKEVILSDDTERQKELNGYFNIILDTVSANKSSTRFTPMLVTEGVYCNVGASKKGELMEIDALGIILYGHRVAGSLIGGIKETQEMLDFCAAKKVAPWIELIPMSQVNEAYARMEKSDVKFRFVMDVKNTAPLIDANQ